MSRRDLFSGPRRKASGFLSWPGLASPLRSALPRLLGLVPALIFGLGMICTPTYAPIVRGGTGAMPEASGGLGAGSARLGFGWSWFTLPVEPRLRVGLSPSLDLEANLLWQGPTSREKMNDTEVMFSLGLQHQVVRHRWFKLAWRTGAGVGRGGAWGREVPKGEEGCDSSWDSCWIAYPGELAWGGYVGLDIGFRLHWRVGLYIGNTFHASKAMPDIPITAWGYHAWGIQLNWTRRLFSSIENGIFWYTNSKDTFSHFNPFYITIIGYSWER